LRRCLLPDPSARRPAVFLDRDGTISEEVGYLNHIDRFRMFPFAPEAIRRLNQAGVPVVVVTNQSGVARGYFPESMLHDVHDRMKRELAQHGAHLDAVYYCPHEKSDACDCRKPKPGMLHRAVEDLGIDLERSYVVGDRYGDIELAFNAGAKGIFVKTGYGLGDFTWHAPAWSRQPDVVTDNLKTAVDWILRDQ
jgi:D-glycero-D-manno-heptose 1,7-bisphosphate phosphatase